ARLDNLSRMYLRELVKTNQVQLNGEYTNVGVRLRSNDFIEIEADMSRGTSMQPENIPLDVVYEDDAIIVVNKPAGMLVHPTHRDKNGTLLNALVYYLNSKAGRLQISGTNREPPRHAKNACHPSFVRRGAFVRPGLVHRLDRETSGLIVVAKTLDSHRRLAREFMKKRVRKMYLALVEGNIAQDEGTISAPIGRYAEKKHWDVKLDGKMSKSRFRVIERHSDTTLLDLEPVTGRTNQLRIHCAHIGHPIVGDVLRGGREFGRLCLHASKLCFRHPGTNYLLSFGSPMVSRVHFLAG
ncbi:MAG TPA: RluA family pseudouridine synthase, partial [Pyrinomonadaceae bacterium]|nr:RluA family pseudouridine synthase [Pyrinomonadaceae bacterium]